MKRLAAVTLTLVSFVAACTPAMPSRSAEDAHEAELEQPPDTDSSQRVIWAADAKGRDTKAGGHVSGGVIAGVLFGSVAGVALITFVLLGAMKGGSMGNWGGGTFGSGM